MDAPGSRRTHCNVQRPRNRGIRRQPQHHRCHGPRLCRRPQQMERSRAGSQGTHPAAQHPQRGPQPRHVPENQPGRTGRYRHMAFRRPPLRLLVRQRTPLQLRAGRRGRKRMSLERSPACDQLLGKPCKPAHYRCALQVLHPGLHGCDRTRRGRQTGLLEHRERLRLRPPSDAPAQTQRRPLVALEHIQAGDDPLPREQHRRRNHIQTDQLPRHVLRRLRSIHRCLQPHFHNGGTLLHQS